MNLSLYLDNESYTRQIMRGIEYFPRKDECDLE